MTETAELVVLPPQDTALDVYATPQGLDPYLARIRDEIDDFQPDPTTRKGREAIASIAYKVSRAKTALDDLGKKLVAELKEKPKLVDAERKRMRDLLDSWREEVRQPLTEWEEAEDRRIAMHRERISAITDAAKELGSQDAETLRSRLANLEAIEIDDSFEEFLSDAATALGKTIPAVRAALATREKYDADQAELARLRAEADERARRDREERIAQEAADKARRDAEAKANAEKEAAQRRETEARDAAERAQRELQDAEDRRIEAERRAEAERLAGEERARQAADDARAEEARRQQAELAQAAAEQRRREADRAHRAEVNRKALDALVAGGLPESHAKKAITLIAKGSVPAVRINY